MTKLIENRGYGIEYVEHEGTLEECLLKQEMLLEMQQEGFDPLFNGDGYPFSYRIEQ